MPNASKAATSTPYIPDITLDRSSPVPLYFQISEPIAELINTGALPADTRLEDELSMAARLHVSRPTARQALQRLVDRGLLKRRRGGGAPRRWQKDPRGACVCPGGGTKACERYLCAFISGRGA